MIYPQKITSKVSNLIINSLLLVSVLIGVLLIFINKLTTPDVHWAAIANCGIIYIWITVMYSFKIRTNIARHVFIQTLLTSIAAIYLDKTLGFNGWSVYIAIPIILIVANITMLILIATSYEKYISYAIYQLGILFISLILAFLMLNRILEIKELNRISIEISILNLLVSLILCHKDIKDAIIRKTHM